jgi:hypothetical protein
MSQFTVTSATAHGKDQSEIIHNWGINPFDISDDVLMEYSFQMIQNFNLIDTFKIDSVKLKTFIKEAHKLYHDVDFHNFKHGWSQMHVSYMILRHGASDYLTPLDMLAVLIGGLCHDLDHPGHNNAYEVVAETDRALTHSFDAVLERHHASLAHRLLKSPGSSILESLTSAEKTYVHQAITDIILATNMADHGSLVKRLEKCSTKSAPFDISDERSRRDLMRFVAHSADISSQVLPFNVAKLWSDRVCAEFMHQSSEEKIHNYPVTQFMTNLDTDEQRCHAQLGFISYVVRPLWTALSACLPRLNDCCIQLQVNHDHYSKGQASN